MLRFIDLRGQDTGHRFAFYDTVTDTFVGPPSWQAWNTEADLRADLAGDTRLERMVGLLPDWVHAPESDDSDEAPTGILVTKAKTLVEMLDEREKYHGSLIGPETLMLVNDLRLELARWK